MSLEIVIIVIFVIGYLGIAFEHPLKINKAPIALVMGMLLWGVFAMNAEHYAPKGSDVHHFLEHIQSHHLFDIASILFFLLGAMTIVETAAEHKGFNIITDKIVTRNRRKLLWIISILTFFFSAALDNLTTSIVMVSVLRILIDDTKDRWFFGGFVIMAANAGGAWSPIGDVTTTMLWNSGQLPDTLPIITDLFLPSLVALLVPLGIVSVMSFTKGNVRRPLELEDADEFQVSHTEKIIVFCLALGALLFVPVFKVMTHLQPFYGMMLGLGVLWIVVEIMHKRKEKDYKIGMSVSGVIQKVDTPSVLFFLGILMAVAVLQETGILADVAVFLDSSMGGNIYAINVIIGILSAIVDNVPLVAGAQGMYEITGAGDFAAGGTFWQFLAYCAGTGGSVLIIGSAAGVAVMGLEKIDFMWYLKRISLLALVGYLAGAGTYMLMFA